MRPVAMARVALMAALTAVMAQVTIPIEPVPFTFQVLAVVLAGYLLGPKYGALALLVYVLVGAVGVPVFSGFGSGPGSLLGPSGGYLWSYPLAAAAAGLAAPALARSRRWVALVSGGAAGLLALVIIYAVGTFWLAVSTNIGVDAAIAAGVVPFVLFDVVKIAFATVLATAVAPRIVSTRLFSGPGRRAEGRRSEGPAG